MVSGLGGRRAGSLGRASDGTAAHGTCASAASCSRLMLALLAAGVAV